MERVIGFVGTGDISEAIIRGLLDGLGVGTRVIISPRNQQIAARLASDHPAVNIAQSNQAVVDEAEIVFLAVRPQIAMQVLKELNFKSGQQVISVIAATDLESLKSWIDADVQLTRAIPLPFVAQKKGVTAIFPPNKTVAELFGQLGTALECETILEYDLLAVASAMMSTYFGIMSVTAQWLVDEGLPERKAQSYLAPLFSSLSDVTLSEGHLTYSELSRSFATPGGLNEQVLQDFMRFGGTQALRRALDRVLSRIQCN